MRCRHMHAETKSAIQAPGGGQPLYAAGGQPGDGAQSPLGWALSNSSTKFMYGLLVTACSSHMRASHTGTWRRTAALRCGPAAWRRCIATCGSTCTSTRPAWRRWRSSSRRRRPAAARRTPACSGSSFTLLPTFEPLSSFTHAWPNSCTCYLAATSVCTRSATDTCSQTQSNEMKLFSVGTAPVDACRLLNHTKTRCGARLLRVRHAGACAMQQTCMQISHDKATRSNLFVLSAFLLSVHHHSACRCPSI